MKVIRSLNTDILTRSQKKGALIAINSIKEKRSIKLKGGTCADGRPQRCYITKEDSSSPAIYLEALFTSLIIDAHEGRYLVIFDFPGAYLSSEMP